MVQKEKAVVAAEKAPEKKSDNVFLDFYNPKTKVKKVFTIDVSKLDKIVLRQNYDIGKDRQTVVLEIPGKTICFTPRLDQLGKISAYISKESVTEVEESL